MNRYVRSASGGERAVSCLDVDAPISCPGEVTLAEVEQLDQLEPYGAGNPRPVFALLGATVDVLQPVGQGKHLKLRLSKGTCRFDAIFFSMTEETCGVAAGMRVDAAFYLQANTFRGNTVRRLLDRAGAAAPPGKGGGGDAALSAAAVGTLRRV